MPESRQHRALLAVSDRQASSALRGYLRARGDVVKSASETDVITKARAFQPCFILLETSSGNSNLEGLRRDLPKIPIIAVGPPAIGTQWTTGATGIVAAVSLPVTDSDLNTRLGAILLSLSCDCQMSAEQNAPSLFDLPSFGSSNSSPRMMEIRDVIGKVANTSATVLIRGESGVGKEIAARLIYQLSERRDKPFVKVACAAIPNDLLESELFGYEAGAFTGAHRSKPGKFELANGGTVFLDEIAEMHPSLQAKLLHVLQDGEFARLGAKRDTSVNARVICATNRPLETQVAEGLFREDLLYRINVVTVNIPPLRERRSEIPGLIQYFLDKYSAVYQRTFPPLDNGTLEAMIGHHWPGNIRELENFCKRYAIMGDTTSMMRELHTRDIPSRSNDPDKGGRAQDRREQISQSSTDTTSVPKYSASTHSEQSLLDIGRKAAWEAECQAIENMLIATRWNRREAARRLQVSYKALLNKIKQMDNRLSGNNR